MFVPSIPPRADPGYFIFTFSVGFASLTVKAYNPPPTNTTAAPNKTPHGMSFPNSQMLSTKLVNLRILRTMLTVREDDCVDSRFTPMMQKSWVAAFAANSNTRRERRDARLSSHSAIDHGADG